MWRVDSVENILTLGKIEGRRKRGPQRMRWLDGITPKPMGVGDEQGGLACCGSWDSKDVDMNEQLSWTEHPLKSDFFLSFFLSFFFFSNNLGHIWPGWIEKLLKHATQWNPKWSIITSWVWHWMDGEALETCHWTSTLYGDKLVNVFKWGEWKHHCGLFWHWNSRWWMLWMCWTWDDEEVLRNVTQ